MRGLIWGFAGRTYHIVGNLMSRLKSWAESPLVAVLPKYSSREPEAFDIKNTKHDLQDMIS